MFVSPYHCLLSYRLTGCLVIRFLSGGRMTIEITEFPLFFSQFALPVTRLLAGPVSLRHTVSDLEGTPSAVSGQNFTHS